MRFSLIPAAKLPPILPGISSHVFSIAFLARYRSALYQVGRKLSPKVNSGKICQKLEKGIYKPKVEFF
jgi:hypothetical protein